MTPHDVITRYKAGYPIDTIARELGVGNRRVRACLADAGVRPLANGKPRRKPERGVHRVIHELDKALGDDFIESILAAGLSDAFWWNARRGASSPTIDNLEALANAAGFEIVLRRRG